MMPVDARARTWLAVVTLAAFLFCAVVVLIPMAERGGFSHASWARLAFRPACHQITDRCLDLGAGPLPVCARCAGLYAGGFAGLLMSLISGHRVRFRFRWLLAAAVPSIIDFFLGLVHLPTLGNWPRFGLALLPGLLAGLLLADAVCTISIGRDDAPTREKIT